MDATRSSSEHPTSDLLTAPAGDRCATCHSPLASDQRYCVSCGERRGKARFSFATLAAQAAPAPAPAPAPVRRGPRVSAGTTLVAGVATLLLALGLGFLMGHLSGKNTAAPVRAAAATPQVIKIDAGSGNTGNTGTSSGGGGGNSNASKKAASTAGLSQFKAPKVKVTARVAQQATQAANKVLGSGANNLAPATAQVGTSCTHGAGCQNGKFTGQFFGP